MGVKTWRLYTKSIPHLYMHIGMNIGLYIKQLNKHTYKELKSGKSVSDIIIIWVNKGNSLSKYDT